MEGVGRLLSRSVTPSPRTTLRSRERAPSDQLHEDCRGIGRLRGELVLDARVLAPPARALSQLRGDQPDGVEAKGSLGATRLAGVGGGHAGRLGRGIAPAAPVQLEPRTERWPFGDGAVLRQAERLPRRWPGSAQKFPSPQARTTRSGSSAAVRQSLGRVAGSPAVRKRVTAAPAKAARRSAPT